MNIIIRGSKLCLVLRLTKTIYKNKIRISVNRGFTMQSEKYLPYTYIIVSRIISNKQLAVAVIFRF